MDGWILFIKAMMVIIALLVAAMAVLIVVAIIFTIINWVDSKINGDKE